MKLIENNHHNVIDREDATMEVPENPEPCFQPVINLAKRGTQLHLCNIHSRQEVEKLDKNIN